MRAAAGIARNRALTIHQFAFGSPILFRFAAMIAAANPLRIPVKAIRSARSPRLRHPKTSTGVEANRKKRAGRIAGSNTCKIIGFISKAQSFQVPITILECRIWICFRFREPDFRFKAKSGGAGCGYISSSAKIPIPIKDFLDRDYQRGLRELERWRAARAWRAFSGEGKTTTFCSSNHSRTS